MSDPKNTHGVPGDDQDADTASGGAPEAPDSPSGADPDEEEKPEEEPPAE